MSTIRGIDLLLYATDSLDAKVVVGGQRGATLSRTADELETTSKDSTGGWKTFTTGFKEWSVEGDGVLVSGDKGFEALEDSFLNNTPIEVELKTSAGRKYTGLGIVIELPLEAPYDDMVTYSITIKGAGELVQATEI